MSSDALRNSWAITYRLWKEADDEEMIVNPCPTVDDALHMFRTAESILSLMVPYTILAVERLDWRDAGPAPRMFG
jgi:hypothetical protein